MKPINTHIEKTTHKGEEVEVIGEVFPDPIKEKPEMSFYTRICIMAGPACVQRIFFERPMDQDQLIQAVNVIKGRLEVYIP